MPLNKYEKSLEMRLREAFLRLKQNQPVILPPGSRVSKSNVAREAGYKDPSSFRRERFPTLVWEIQAHEEIVASAHPSAYYKKKQRRIEKASFEQRFEQVKAQRDEAQSKLVSLRRAYLELLKENDELRRNFDKINPVVKLL